MPFTIATGVELGAADSYVSLLETDAYFEAMQDSDWLAVDDDKKLWLLRRASTLINQRYLWTTVTVPYTSVPRALAIATFELAKHWSLAPISGTVTESSALKSVAIGAISVEFAGAGESGAPEQIYSFLDGLLARLGSPRVVAIAGASTGWGTIAMSRG